MSLKKADAMLTCSGVAIMLHVHVNTVRRWTNEGLLECHRIGHRGDRRFTEAQIKAFLKSPGTASLRSQK